MIRVVQVRVGEKGDVQYYDAGEWELKVGSRCIMEGERGLDAGEVLSEPEMLSGENFEQPPRKILRTMTEEDIKKVHANEKDAAGAFDVCENKIAEKNLAMKLVAVEYSFDRSRLLFYFTAEGRIDFRELVKDLAGVFKTRIELRQIGVRDEARIMGGIGPCGRTLCCASFLHSFEPINIRMAKTQRLPLDPDKISGVCGRLFCCLKYEDGFYKSMARRFPRDGATVITPQGEGKVTDLNYLRQEVTVELEDDKKTVFPVKEVKVKREKPSGDRPKGSRPPRPGPQQGAAKE